MILITSQDEIRKIATEMILPVNNLVIELGCADGNFASFLNGNIPSHKYIGIDILEEQIKKAKENFPDFTFLNLDICKNLDILKIAEVFCSFQVLEHLGTIDDEKDCEVLSILRPGTRVIISVPNSPYKKEHKRWFELDGWKERYSQYIKFDYDVIIQNPIKKDRRSFLLSGTRIGKQDGSFNNSQT